MDVSQFYHAFVVTESSGQHREKLCLTAASSVVASRFEIKGILEENNKKITVLAVPNYRVGDSVLTPTHTNLNRSDDLDTVLMQTSTLNLGPVLKHGDIIQAPGQFTAGSYHQSNSDIKSVFHNFFTFSGLELHCSLLLKNTKITEVIETRQRFDCVVEKVTKSKNLENGTVVVAEPVDQSLRYKGNEVFVANVPGFFLEWGKVYQGSFKLLTPSCLYEKYPALKTIDTFVLIDKKNYSGGPEAGLYILENGGSTILKQHLSQEEIGPHLQYLQERFISLKGKDFPFVVVRNCEAYTDPQPLLNKLGFDTIRLSTRYPKKVD